MFRGTGSYAGRVFVLFIVSLLFISCEESPQSPEGEGTLFVKVTGDYYNNFVEGATITTEPATDLAKTDELGTCTIEQLSPGIYQVAATKPGVGSGKESVNVEAGKVTTAEIRLVEDADFSFAPSVEIIQPRPEDVFAPGNRILFRAEVSDPTTKPGDLSIEWSSDQDGMLGTVTADTGGIAEFATSSLSPAEHIIVVSVTDEDNYTSADSIPISTLAPDSVFLGTSVSTNGVVRLTWQHNVGNDFVQYDVFRATDSAFVYGVTNLATITDPSVTTFRDTILPFVEELYYRVTVTNDAGYTRRSNTEEIQNPVGLVIDFIPYDVVKHPTQPLLYLLYRDGDHLVVANYETMEIVNEKMLSGTPGYMDIITTGGSTELYIPNRDGWVYIYDAATLTEVSAISTGESNECVLADGDGYVYVSMDTYYEPIQTYSRATGDYIDGNGDHDGDRMRFLPGNTEMISISTSVIPVDMEYFLFDGAGNFVEHHNDPYHGDHPLDPEIFRISPNGNFLVTSQSGAVYYADSSLEYKGQIQRGSAEFSDFAFSENGNTIYGGTSNLRSILVATYPNLLQTGQKATRGYPAFIFRDGTELISVSRTSDSVYENSVGIEKININ